MPYDELFDDIVDSHEVGLRKPNPAIYELALTRLERTAGPHGVPGRCAVQRARRRPTLGMYGVLVDEDSAPAIAEVDRLAGLPRSPERRASGVAATAASTHRTGAGREERVAGGEQRGAGRDDIVDDEHARWVTQRS